MSLDGPSSSLPNANVIVYIITEKAHCNKKNENVYKSFKKALSSDNSFEIKPITSDPKTQKKTDATQSVFIATTDQIIANDPLKQKKFVFKEIPQKKFEELFPNSQDVVAIDISRFKKRTVAVQGLGTGLLTRGKNTSSMPTLPTLSREKPRAQTTAQTPLITPPPEEKKETSFFETSPQSKTITWGKADKGKTQPITEELLTNIQNLSAAIKKLEEINKKTGRSKSFASRNIRSVISEIVEPIKKIKDIFVSYSPEYEHEDWGFMTNKLKELMSSITKVVYHIRHIDSKILSTADRDRVDDEIIQILDTYRNIMLAQNPTTHTSAKKTASAQTFLNSPPKGLQTPPKTETASNKASASLSENKNQKPFITNDILIKIQSFNLSVQQIKSKNKTKGIKNLFAFRKINSLILETLDYINAIKIVMCDLNPGKDWVLPIKINKFLLNSLINARSTLHALNKKKFSDNKRKKLDDNIIQLLRALSNITPTHEPSTHLKQLEVLLAVNENLIKIYTEQMTTKLESAKKTTKAEKCSQRAFFVSLLLPLYKKNYELAEELLVIKGENPKLKQTLEHSKESYYSYLKEHSELQQINPTPNA